MVKPKPGRIRQLLDADERNSRISPQLMTALHPWAVAAFEDTATLFRLLYHSIGDWEAENLVDQQLRHLGQKHGLTDEQLIQRLKAGTASDIDGADALWARLWTLRMVKYTVMACQRYWSWGAAELFRLRHTAALGYLRLEAEAMALTILFLENNSLARQWSELRTPQDGQKFFGATQTPLKEILAKYDLKNVYNIASGSAQHVRMAGLVRSMMNNKPGVLSLPDQEFNQGDPYSFHLGIAHFHRMQARVLPALGTVLPNVRTEKWVTDETAFVQNAAALWHILEEKYAKEIAEQAEG
jgi:hypothetical protein